MRSRLFGPTGLRVCELFLGAMTFGEQGGGGAPPEEFARILGAYAAAGGNVIDTAINYRGGQSEEILGQLLAERRDRFVLSTKYTVTRDRDDPNAAGNHRKNLRESLETSLRRLRTDYIDIYWVHMGRSHPGRGDPAHPRRPGPSREDPLYRDLRSPCVGDRPGQHSRRLAWVGRVRLPAGAVQPAAPRHRTRSASHGRNTRPDPGSPSTPACKARPGCNSPSSPTSPQGQATGKEPPAPQTPHHTLGSKPMSDLQAIADRVEIEALRGEFSDAVMMNDHDRLASLFTPDGAVRIPLGNIEAAGREQIRALGERRQALADYFLQTTHPGTIALDGDTATGRAYLSELARLRDGNSHLNYFVYHDRYQRTGDGWKFTERVAEFRYLDTTPLAGSPPPVAGDAS